MIANLEEEKRKAEASGQHEMIQLREFLKSPVVKPFAISMGLMFFQQFTGINAIIYNTVSIFQTAGSTIDSRYCTIIVGFVQLVFTIFSGFFVSFNRTFC